MLDMLAGLPLPSFADWVVVDLVDDAGVLSRARLDHGVDVGGDASGSLADAVPGLAGVVDRVISSGVTETWPNDATGARAIVVGMRVKDRSFGAVSFVQADGRAAYRDLDVAVAEEFVWGVGSIVERLALQLDGRQALRAAQRMARQLHQLFVATVNISSLRDEREIAAAVAQSARRIFDAERAIIRLDALGVVASVRRGEARPHFEALKGDVAFEARDTEPQSTEGWLVVRIDERTVSRYGSLAIKCGSTPFVAEDREIATLLAQAAAIALSTTSLARGVERSEARLRALVETAPVGILEVSDDLGVRWWNRAAERIFGWSAPESSARPTVPAALTDAFSELWAAARSGGGPALRDLVDVELRGRVRDLTSAAALVDLPGEQESILMVLIDDVTDHRQLKAEVAYAQQMEIRGRVASSVAHDFNNLLTLITGYAEILARELTEDRLTEMVRDIQSTASRASMLTAQLQSIGRTRELAPVVLAPTDVVRANAEVLERIVGGNVELELLLDDGAGGIRVDAAQFEQMLLNLAINARDAMPDGGRLRIGVDGVVVDEERAAALGVEPGPFVLVTASDTGTGMDDGTMAQCFDAFFTMKGPFKGTGLGLAAARRLAEASGGAITVKRALGVGTTFEVLFPVTREAVVVELASAAPRRARGFATVLVAEDDEGLLRLMVQVLTRNGYQVLAGASGEEALAIAERFDGPIDLLVSDVDTRRPHRPGSRGPPRRSGDPVCESF